MLSRTKCDHCNSLRQQVQQLIDENEALKRIIAGNSTATDEYVKKLSEQINELRRIVNLPTATS